MEFFAKKKEERLMRDKTSRAIGIALSYTPAEDLTDVEGRCFGKAVFKIKKAEAWVEYEVVLRENVGKIVPGDQWIVKLDEDYTRIVTPQLKLCKNSDYRIFDVE